MKIQCIYNLCLEWIHLVQIDMSQNSFKKPRGYYVDYSRKQKDADDKYRAPTSGNKRFSQTPDLVVGQRGFLLTTSDEVKSYLEMRRLFEDYYEKFYGKSQRPCDSEATSAVEDDIEAELQQLKMSRPFRQVKTHCRNTVFIKINDELELVDPSRLVDGFFDDLSKEGLVRTRHTLRVLPVIYSSRNTVASVNESLTKILVNNYKCECKSFFIELHSRGNYKSDSETKKAMIEAVAETVVKLRPDWKVDRTNADYIIVLTLMKQVCCISILKEFFARKKYNVTEFCKTLGIEHDEPANEMNQES